VADDVVLAPAVERHAGGVDPAPVGLAHELRRDGTERRVAREVRPERRQRAVVEHAVGVEQQHRVAVAHRREARVHRRRVRAPLGQPHDAAVLAGDLLGRVDARVVDDDDLVRALARGGGQARLEPLGLVDREHEDGRSHRSSS
jgi:hypothetical protein